MASHSRDWTDSEPEQDQPQNQVGAGSEMELDQRSPRHAASEEKMDSRAQTPNPEVKEEELQRKPVKPKSGESHHPLKITLRPSINHLMHGEASTQASSSSSTSTSASTSKPKPRSRPKSKPKAQPVNRSSLSPPPPITLKLGFKHAMAEKATYSSSEEDDDPRPIPPPSKKKKKSSSTSGPSTKSTAGKGKAHPPPPSAPGSVGSNASPKAGASGTVPVHNRKSYDWLAPSAAGASHRGPREREGERPGSPGSGANGAAPSSTTIKITGWSPADEAIGGLLEDSPEAGEKKGRKSHKKRAADAPAGPGKAWRKGIKKALREDGGATPTGTPPTNATNPDSREGSPEHLEIPPPRNIEPAPIQIAPPPRAPSPPFILADAATLGFPVFPKPIMPPKIHLGAYPKVTQYFAPINGGDAGPFPRKENVRNWTRDDKVMIGIGGGSLKVKSWIPGPPSELGRLVQADKEAKELARLAKTKAAAASAAAAANATANVGHSASDAAEGGEIRPPLTTANSFDTPMGTPVLTPQVAGAGASERGDEEMSELADEDLAATPGTSTPVPTPTPTPTPGQGHKGKSKLKAKQPRKSKLANEIIVPSEVEGESEGEGAAGQSRSEVVA